MGAAFLALVLGFVLANRLHMLQVSESRWEENTACSVISVYHTAISIYADPQAPYSAVSFYYDDKFCSSGNVLKFKIYEETTISEGTIRCSFGSQCVYINRLCTSMCVKCDIYIYVTLIFSRCGTGLIGPISMLRYVSTLFDG